ncbi:VPLPA-CTERM sorting domain-containing protein [Cognatiyoonia sediminum]|uniref:VPLPA-CTERM sorting domain-containing protein n=1 Tax=Cognatiyoonia sediminum TaxID=1508389 RepID=UPI0009F83251
MGLCNGSLFTKATFTSTLNAFEIGNLAFEVVPLPASSLLLLAGLGGLAAMKRRKSK